MSLQSILTGFSMASARAERSRAAQQQGAAADVFVRIDVSLLVGLNCALDLESYRPDRSRLGLGRAAQSQTGW